MKFKTREKFNSVNSESFLRLEPNKPVYALLVGDIYEFRKKFDEEGKPHIVPPGTLGAKFQFRVNAVIGENGAFVSRILEGGSMIYDRLEELHNEHDLEKVVVKIGKKGAGMNTRYSVDISAKQPSKEQLARMKEVPLQDLGNGSPAQSDLQNDNQDADSDGDELPF
jgi:hypothetical protein